MIIVIYIVCILKLLSLFNFLRLLETEDRLYYINMNMYEIVTTKRKMKDELQ